jgi:uncharacterized protein (TIGR02145 family)
MYQRIILLILFPLCAFSQAPQKINFQSILRNTNGEVVANKTVSLKISILSGSIGGSAAYSETHTKTTDASGLISLQIGAGTVLSGVFANIGWGDFPHFIKLEADFSGGSNFVVLGSQELMSVPYALYASKTDTSSLNLVNRFSSKVSISDTSNMLTNYRIGLNNKLNISDFPIGTTLGNIQYWNGTTWVNLAPGQNGQILILTNGIPSWSGAAYPTLTTTSISSITSTSVNGGGNISSDGGAAVSARGLVYATTSNPTLSNTILIIGSGTGSFSGTLTGLTPNTTYYIRAYATNSAGTGYGNEVSFQTLPVAVPSLITTDASGITQTTITTGGTISNDGGATITERGIVYGTSTNPTTSNTKVTSGSGTGSFSININALTPNTTYYIRSYAINSAGTGYGNQKTFTTSPPSNTLPVVTSTSVTGLTQNQATFNAEVYSQGGGTVTERGAVWNTSGNPTVNSNRIPSGAGTGVYTTTITGLSGGVNYYVRSYAINNFGISYGVEIPFTTLFGLATLTTNNVIAQSITASSGGNITDNGGSTVTARGVVWNTTGTPTISNSKTTDGSGTGSYVSNISALSPSTTYFVRAYATNSAGTAYGNEQTFTTVALSPQVKDIDGNTYNTVQIGAQVWMSENLKTSRYRNGGSIPYVVGNTEWLALTTGAWSYYNHDEANNVIYGKLYNWFTTQGDTLCPVGWHVPSDGEWTTLTTYLGGESSSLPKLLKIGMNFWGNFPATNESGFSAVPGGYRSINFYGIGTGRAYFWSKSDFDIYDGITRLLAIDGVPMKSNSPKISGLSIRCIKNEKPILTTINVRTQSTLSISGGDITSDGGSAVTARGVVWNTSGSPTLLDRKTIDGSGIGSFVSNLEGLIPNTTYYVRAYATNSEGTNFGNQQTFTTTQTVTDIDGNIYNTVQIGSQLWMSENLKTSRYKNGDSIPIISNRFKWLTLTTGARSWYNNDSTSYEYPYGNLYNWYSTIDRRGLCPTSWHVPSDSEWATLTSYLGGENVAGGKMKSIGTAYWHSPNTGATNESGFSALPGGFSSGGSFINLGFLAFFWSTSNYDNNNPININIYSELVTVEKNGYQYLNPSISFGASVRCLKNPLLPLLSTDSIKYVTVTTAICGGNVIVNGESTVIARGVVWNTTGNPTISDSKTIDDSGIGPFISNLTGLNPNTIYYVRAYATNNGGTAYGNELTFSTTQALTDIDRNTYNTVKIGTQIWMSENLRTTKYRNGSPIPNVVGNSDWISLSTGAWSYYNNDSSNNEIYGKLYNWFTIQGDTLCPLNWHVPSDLEWRVLLNYLGGWSASGGKLKSIGTAYWNIPNIGATNESGFSALPGGTRFFNNGIFSGLNNSCYFWTSTEDDSTSAWDYGLQSTSAIATILGVYFKSGGASIRCIKNL